mmetsp:Transcript_11692/g.34801  ORF Transcript_11692/g.34801 Transcript_11692/m.34801 type:complete len:250 (+) Transcript_11692:141-890(+)
MAAKSAILLLCAAAGARAATFAADDTTIREAVTEYFEFPAAAETKYGKIGEWDVSRVTDFSELFCASSQCSYSNLGAGAFNEDISSWDTGAATTFRRMFREAKAFNADISGWDTSSAKDMSAMFFFAVAFDADISGWATGQVTTMLSLFDNAHAFNRDISSWDIGNVESFAFFAYYAHAFNQNLGWCLAMSEQAVEKMFEQNACELTDPLCGVTIYRSAEEGSCDESESDGAASTGSLLALAAAAAFAL